MEFLILIACWIALGALAFGGIASVLNSLFGR